jgi:NADH pyrophosphatase NudC (nudix superfamily)
MNFCDHCGIEDECIDAGTAIVCSSCNAASIDIYVMGERE